MRGIVLAVAGAVLAGCAAQLTFIDRTDGQSYRGATGSTLGNTGELTAVIDGATYSGTWIYSEVGGGYSLGVANATGTATAVSAGRSMVATGASFGTLAALSASAQGRGLITMRTTGGEFMRCVFDFNTMSDTGLGECIRNDGRHYDLAIKR